MKNSIRLLVAGALSLIMLTAAAGCGKNGSFKFVTAAQVRGYVENGDAYVELKATLNVGSMSVIGIELPIYHHSEEIGKFSIAGSALSVLIDVSKAADLNMADATLPNGGPVPVSTGSVPIYAFPVGSQGARVYVAYGTGVAMLGVAAPVKQLDGMPIPEGSSIFIPFDFGNGITGTGGVFAGSGSGTSGFGIFADISSALHPASQASSQTSALTSAMVQAVSTVSRSATTVAARNVLTFGRGSASSDATDTINYRLYKLNKKRASLQVN